MQQIDKKIIEKIKQGGVGVLPTDTLYGLVGSALSKKAVERIFQLKKRDPSKPLIILIADIDDLELFGINLPEGEPRFWPGAVSIILQCPRTSISFLHRGTKTLAFRLPKPKWLRDLLRKTGPLVAPSANLEDEKPAQTIEQAKNYFGNKVDFYVDAGKLTGLPSTLIKIDKKGRVEILRQGSTEVRPM